MMNQLMQLHLQIIQPIFPITLDAQRLHITVIFNHVSLFPPIIFILINAFHHHLLLLHLLRCFLSTRFLQR
ncbi:hypothetical protein HanRHA438_Chr15g0705841 [Helianthus annuus]|nr:hypothetical protein HanRHA438_Chr15g0705841 [Helianthus annuus]